MERKLAAILSADVQGYSRLMGDDEEATIRTLTAYREVMSRLIQQHRGRVVDSPGDNLLAEFGSAVDAVEGAIAIQHALKTKNADLATDRQMHYRIGINVGDVVVEGERIYGDGVNIAARLESLAEGGGICISGNVYEQVENKLDITCTYQGEQTVKNIAKPVRVYKIELEAASVSDRRGAVPAPVPPVPPLPLPDKPSIAVLPFTNMSNDPEQEYFSDGITEDLITDLSKISGLFVIARNSVFTYKGQAVKVTDVGRELGVRYVLEGSIRKAGDQVRVTAQLVEAATGGHLWAERYDRKLTDIFALQDEITQKIVFALKITLTPAEHAKFQQAPTTNMDAYNLYLQGVEATHRSTKNDIALAQQFFEQAITLDPRYAAAYARLGFTHFIQWGWQWSDDPSRSLELAFERTQRAVALDDTLGLGHQLLGWVHVWHRRYEQAVTCAERALAVSPNDAENYAMFGDILVLVGRPAEALGMIERAIRLNPNVPYLYHHILGHAYYFTGRCAEGAAASKQAMTLNPSFLPAYLFLAVNCSECGQQEEAEEAITTLTRLNPKFIPEVLRVIPYKNPQDAQRLRASLAKAGWKEA